LALISSQQQQKPRLDIIKIKKIEQQLNQQLEYLEREIKNMELQIKDIEREQELQLQVRQQKEQQQQQKQQPILYIVKRKIMGNLWEPVSHFDENNNFRGLAVFSTEEEAFSYQKRFEDKLVLRDLRDKSNRCRMITKYKNKTTLKVFKENSLPTIKRYVCMDR
jgi:hypothetical protein